MEQSKMTRERRFYKRHPIISQIIVGVIGIVVGAVVQSFISAKNEDMTRKALVKEMSETFDDVDESMTFRKAIETITESYKLTAEENQNLIKNLNEKETEIEALKSNMSDMPNVEYYPIDIVMDELKTEGNIKNGWVAIDGADYYSEDVVNCLLNTKVQLDKTSKTLYFTLSM